MSGPSQLSMVSYITYLDTYTVGREVGRYVRGIHDSLSVLVSQMDDIILFRLNMAKCLHLARQVSQSTGMGMMGAHAIGCVPTGKMNVRRGP